MTDNKQWLRPADSGLEDIFSQLWTGDTQRAVIQLVHGMSEHTARYDEFARYLAEHGFVVCMNEHAGHGSHARTLGYFAEKDGMEHVVADMKSLMDEVTAAYPTLPVFMLGHSMGSFLARKYIALYGNTLAGCIISGTSGYNPALGLAVTLASVQKKLKGPKSAGKLLTSLGFGAYTKKIENPVNSFAWLSSVDELCTAYAEDPYCGFPFTASGYHDLFSLLQDINKPECFSKIPAGLPIYLFSGEDDPVGDYGKGVTAVYENMKATGIQDISIKLYPGGRHEMLNEVNKYEVYEDVLSWLNVILSPFQLQANAPYPLRAQEPFLP